jgi:hypothetical protein
MVERKGIEMARKPFICLALITPGAGGTPRRYPHPVCVVDRL